MREADSHARRFAKTLRPRMTEAEVILWSQLRAWRAQGCRFRRQHPIGPFIADFACVSAKLVVELDGDQHGADCNHAYDKRRDAYMRRLGWRVVRISNDQIFRELGKVLAMLGDLAVPPLRLAKARHLPRFFEGVRWLGFSPRGRKIGAIRVGAPSPLRLRPVAKL